MFLLHVRAVVDKVDSMIDPWCSDAMVLWPRLLLLLLLLLQRNLLVLLVRGMLPLPRLLLLQGTLLLKGWMFRGWR